MESEKINLNEKLYNNGNEYSLLIILIVIRNGETQRKVL